MSLCRTEITARIATMHPNADGATPSEMRLAVKEPMMTIAELVACNHDFLSIPIGNIRERQEDFQVAYDLIKAVRTIMPELIQQLREESVNAIITDVMSGSEETIATPMEAMICGCIVGIVVGQADASRSSQVTNN